MQTYYELSEYFKTQLESSDYIKTVLNQDAIVNKFEVENYDTALAIVAIQPETSEESHVVYSVRVECVDMLDVSNEIGANKYEGNNNVIDVYNSTLATVRRLHLELTHKVSGSNEIQVDPSPTFEKLYDANQNVAGTSIDMTIRIDDAVTNLCN